MSKISKTILFIVIFLFSTICAICNDKIIVENKGKVIPKDELFNKIWGFDSESEPQTLTVHIKWLRDKIEENPKEPSHIQTVWGKGYRYE